MTSPATAAERILAAVPDVATLGFWARQFFDEALAKELAAVLAAQRERIAAFAQDRGSPTLAKQIRAGEAG